MFEQVLELGEDDPSFLREMVGAYFDQAANTFRDMDVALCVFWSSACSHRTALTDVVLFRPTQGEEGSRGAHLPRPLSQGVVRGAWRVQGAIFVREDPTLWQTERRERADHRGGSHRED